MASSNNPTKNMSNNNLIIIMLLVTFLVVGVSALAVNFLIKTITLDSKLVSKKLAAEKQLKENIVAAPNLIEAYRDLGEERVLLEDALPTSSDFPSLLVTLENMSKDATMGLSSVTESMVQGVVASATDATAAAAASASPAPTSATGKTPTSVTATAPVSVTPTPETFAFVINVKGGYQSLLTMLDHLERSARPMRVTGLQILGSPTGLDVTINVETYYQKSSDLPFGKETVK